MENAWNSVASAYAGRILTTDRILYPAALQAIGMVREKNILDVGCGVGHFSDDLNRSGAHVIGIDNSSEMIKIARKNYPALEFHQSDAEDIKFEIENFDSAVAIMTFLCFDRKQKIEQALKTIYKKLNKKGTLIIIDLHPCAKRSFTSKIVNQIFPEKSYFHSGIRFQTMLTNKLGEQMKFFNYHWTLEDYFQCLQRAGWVVKELKELKPTKEDVLLFPQLQPFLENPHYLLIKAEKK